MVVWVVELSKQPVEELIFSVSSKQVVRVLAGAESAFDKVIEELIDKISDTFTVFANTRKERRGLLRVGFLPFDVG